MNVTALRFSGERRRPLILLVNAWHVMTCKTITKYTLLGGNSSEKLSCFLIPIQFVCSYMTGVRKVLQTDQKRVHYGLGKFCRYDEGNIPLILRQHLV